MSERSNQHRVHHVLVVDDSPDIRDAMACLLRVRGWDVATAANGSEVFQSFENGLRPCMMLLDLCMPDMDGWEVWDRMRAHDEWQTTPVVILSGEPPDPVRAREVGIRAFLQKPRSVPDILEAVERHCRLASGQLARV